MDSLSRLFWIVARLQKKAAAVYRLHKGKEPTGGQSCERQQRCTHCRRQVSLNGSTEDPFQRMNKLTRELVCHVSQQGTTRYSKMQIGGLLENYCKTLIIETIINIIEKT
ncbi:hypothetical protein CDAR_393881 [Caerostris darwini]|uniref:Uncharacterized protein n=1 Tax=Caerostris darwini TaxID=1538125 RepID=A0AAV4PD77_9ARAC|nr:hypothetical protein CDAR_393881 [Caerostris darwini]